MFLHLIIAIVPCLDSGVKKMERQFSDSNPYWKEAERTWLISMMGGMKYFPLEVVDKVGKEMTMG